MAPGKIFNKRSPHRAEGKVKVTIEQQATECINTVFSRLKERKANGCVVLKDGS